MSEPTLIKEIKEESLEIQANEIQEPSVESSILDIIEYTDKPWYFSTSEIYKLAKSTAVSIPHSQRLFERAINAIQLMTQYINETTKLNVEFDVKGSQELINKLDVLLSEQLIFVDDGFDDLRAKFTLNLRNLIQAIILQKNWAESYAKDTTTAAKSSILTRYEQFLLLLSALREQVTNRYPETIEKISSFANKSIENVHTNIDQVKKTVENKVQGLRLDFTAQAWQVLLIAQPYVQSVYLKSTPYISQAVEISQPYVAQAIPFVNPVLTRATELHKVVLQNKSVGPYVSKVYETANFVIDETRTYVIPTDGAAAPVNVVAAN